VHETEPPRGRHHATDVLRGTAVLGILLLNIVAMGLPHWAYDDPTVFGTRTPVDFYVWAAITILFEGKMRAVFSMLFGASIVLLAERVEAAGGVAAEVHLRRLMWLLLFGLVHAYLLLWSGEILFFYAVAGIPLVFVRRVRASRLAAMGVLVLALQAPKLAVHNLELREAAEGLAQLDAVTTAGRTLTPGQTKKRDAYRETLSGEKPTPETLHEVIETRRSTYLRNLGLSASQSLYVESLYFYKFGLWDALGMMLIGMALLKRGVLTGDRSMRFYGLVAIVGFGLGVPLETWVVVNWMHHGFAAGARWTSLSEVTRLATALGHVGLVMMVSKGAAAEPLTRPLAAVGRMALTNYIAQTIIAMTLFCGFGFGLYGQLSRHQLYYIVAVIWAFQIVASAAWLRRFRYGPLEWLWRSLTYGRWQPMRIPAVLAPAAGLSPGPTL